MDEDVALARKTIAQFYPELALPVHGRGLPSKPSDEEPSACFASSARIAVNRTTGAAMIRGVIACMPTGI